jgi:hypothetical protein
MTKNRRCSGGAYRILNAPHRTSEFAPVLVDWQCGRECLGDGGKERGHFRRVCQENMTKENSLSESMPLFADETASREVGVA